MSGYVGYASEIDFRVSLDRTIRMVIFARVMVLVEIVVDQFAVKAVIVPICVLHVMGNAHS